MLYYDNIKPPTPTTLYILSIYRATPDVPLDTQSIDDITHRGRVLTLETGKDAEPITLLDNLHMPDGITISQKLGRIFWTQMGNPLANDGAVMSANLDGSGAISLLPPGAVHTPKQIIIDEEAGKLYFCDREGLRVHRCDLDGGGQEILVQTGDWVLNKDHQNEQTRWCVGIAISKKLGKIFWTQKGAPKSKQGRIFSANIDIPAGFTGQNRPDIELVAGDLPEPIDLEFDEDAGALYWTDRGEFPFGNTLNKKTLLGDVPASEQKLGRQILAEGFAEAIGLALDKENECAWVADLAGRVWKCDVRKPAAKQKIFESETSVFTGLAVMHTEASL
ncbi:Putative six-bladed beta-propeller, TolB [Septoria linicola]|uniref:Six-bladed beta-propeller, TolB n=1 Tax=Septoria linicola TaxID=215465 RepID=A0A9Q9B4C8_9PEZI|nr:Putative six-bladed beta-propeller, TolB [Septoria linicola]